MKYYEKLLALGCFTRQDIEQITGSKSATKWICREYMKKGYIERVKHDLYVATSLETQQPVANRYAIASHINDDAIISYHSAFEYYGYANQVFYEVHVTSNQRFGNFNYDGINYLRFIPKITTGIVQNSNGIRVTTLERTVIDCINLFEKVCGLEELLKCIELIPSLNVNALLECLTEYDNGFLYKKAGYILSFFKNSLTLPNEFFEKCKANLPKGKSYLHSQHKDFVWNEEWKIYAPLNLEKLIDKGVRKYDEI